MRAAIGEAKRDSRNGATPWAALALAVVASGCSWGWKARPAQPRETLELESFTATAPDGPGWTVRRNQDVGWRLLDLRHGGGRVIEISEHLGAADLPRAREAWLAHLRATLPQLAGDSAATVTEVVAPLDPRFGSSATQVLAVAEESDASAGLLVKRVASGAWLQFVPPGAPDRVCGILYRESAHRGATAEQLQEAWRALLAGVVLRPVDDEAVRKAARPDFPKSFDAGLARRSLTLPRNGFQWRLWRESWIAPGGFDGSWGLAYGITDRLELSTPGYLRYALGDPEALAGPEFAVGLGLTRYEHDATRGSVWGGGVSASARRRVGANVAATAELALEGTHESRTGENDTFGAAAAGVVWDVPLWGLEDLLSLALEVGYAADDEGPSPKLVWVGGRRTPLVTAHLLLLDVALTGGVGWDGEDVGALVGFEVGLTF